LPRGQLRPGRASRRGAGDRSRLSCGLPLAIHPLGRRASAFRQGAVRADHRTAEPAHSGGALHPSIAAVELTDNQANRSIIMDGNTTTIAPKVVNGINLDDLFALIGRVRSEPANGKTKWRVATTWAGPTRRRAGVEGPRICGARHGGPRAVQ